VSVFHALEGRLERELTKRDSFNYNKGNIQQDPPMTEEWFSRDIYTSTPFSPPHNNHND
jgi:hypothetical protein